MSNAQIPFIPPQAPSLLSDVSAAGAPAQVVAIPSMPSATGRPMLVDIESFIRDATRTETAWLWDGVIPDTGIVMLAGAPFSGKTVTTVLLSVAACGGRELAGRQVLDSNILYVKLEHLDSDFANLFQMAKLGAGLGVLDNLHVLRSATLDDDESLAHIKSCAEQVDAHVVVVDSLRRASQFDENSSQESAEIMRRLQGLTNNGTRLVIAIHHLAKGGVATPRGSGDLLAAVDGFVAVTKSGDVVTLNAMHHAGGDRVVRIRLDFAGGKLTATAVDATSGQQMSTDRARVEAVIPQLCSQQDRTRTGLRKAVRQALPGIQIGNEAIDTTADDLARRGTIQNLGTPKKHRWRTIVPSVPAGAFTTAPSS